MLICFLYIPFTAACNSFSSFNFNPRFLFSCEINMSFRLFKTKRNNYIHLEVLCEGRHFNIKRLNSMTIFSLFRSFFVTRLCLYLQVKSMVLRFVF